MGTRGVIGFREKGKDILTYNHFDSYPTNLGKKLLTEIREAGLESLAKVPGRLVHVEEDRKPTPKQLQLCYQFLKNEVEGQDRAETYEEFIKRIDDSNIGEQGRHWYKVLRQTQGTFKYALAGLPFFMGGYGSFIYDGSCEWSYIVNLDTAELEIYTMHWSPVKGERNYYPHMKPRGRYACGENGNIKEDYGSQLLDALPLDEVVEASDAVFERYCARLYRAH